jgi:hypothetical protein
MHEIIAFYLRVDTSTVEIDLEQAVAIFANGGRPAVDAAPANLTILLSLAKSE